MRLKKVASAACGYEASRQTTCRSPIRMAASSVSTERRVRARARHWLHLLFERKPRPA